MTEILVTGSSGAIGTALLSHLTDSEHGVVGVDIDPNQWGYEQQTLQTDLRQLGSLPDADVIIHLAAHSQVQPMIDTPSLAIENIQMTKQVLAHAADTKAHVILASSREVYGSAVRPSIDDITSDVSNPYGASKIGSEAIASAYAECEGVEVTVLRFTNVYGPYDLNPRVIPIFIARGLDGKELVVHGESKLLDFIYIDDVVTAVIETIRHRDTLVGEIITVGSGTGTQLTTLAELIEDKIDGCPGYTVEANRTGDTEKFVAAIEKAKTLLDFDPRPLSVGIESTIDWYRTHEQARAVILDQLSTRE